MFIIQFSFYDSLIIRKIADVVINDSIDTFAGNRDREKRIDESYKLKLIEQKNNAA